MNDHDRRGTSQSESTRAPSASEGTGPGRRSGENASAPSAPRAATETTALSQSRLTAPVCAPCDAAPMRRPRTPDELHALLRGSFDITIPRAPLAEGHQAPFDYICHAFFEEPPAPPGGAAGVCPPRGHAVRAAGPRDCVVWANRGGGKTFLGAVATMLDLAFKPGIAVRILGGSLEQSRRMHAHLAALFDHPLLGEMLEGRITRTSVRLANGSACELLAQSQTSVRGTRVQKLRCDEVELFDPEVWEAAQLTTRSRQCGEVFVRGAIECLSTMHRPYGIMFNIVKEAAAGQRTLFKWSVLDVLGPCGDEHACLHDTEPPDAAGDLDRAPACPLYRDCRGRAKHRDSAGGPPGHLSVEDAVTQLRRVGEETWRSEMLCLHPRRTDTVVPEFAPGVHVVSDLPPALERACAARGGAAVERSDGAHADSPWLTIAGMDFGYRSPTVVLRALVDGEGVIWVVEERVATGKLLQTHIDWLRSRTLTPPPDWVGVDPAGLQRQEQTGASNIDQMRRAGLTVRHRRAGLAAGLTALRSRLAPASGPARLLVHERCQRLIESLQRYRYSEGGESLVPVKDGHDHAVDALRYMVLNHDRPYLTTLTNY